MPDGSVTLQYLGNVLVTVGFHRENSFLLKSWSPNYFWDCDVNHLIIASVVANVNLHVVAKAVCLKLRDKHLIQDCACLTSLIERRGFEVKTT